MVYLSSLALLVLLASPCFAQETWQPDEFPVGYWCGPPPRYNTLEAWQQVKDCGFNMGGVSGGFTRDDNLKMLKLCKQVGIKTLVVDSRIWARMQGSPRWKETLAEVVNDYKDFESLYGYFITDEPGHLYFSLLGDTAKELKRLDPKRLPYINLLPTYGTPTQFGTPIYEEYLERFLTNTETPVLSYDHYCLGAKEDSTQYFENLRMIREAALRHNAMPWNIIQAMSYDRAIRQPVAEEMRWQVYTSLAYGMKGILYFVYWSYNDNPLDMGIVDYDGAPGPLYEPVKQLNSEIKKLGKTLLHLTSTGVFHTGVTPPGATRMGVTSLLSVTDDVPLVVGFFKDEQSKDYALIASNDYTQTLDFTLTAKPHVTGISQVSPIDEALLPVELDEGKAYLSLAPGDGILLQIDTEFKYPVPPAVSKTIDFNFDTDGDQEGWDALAAMASPVVADGIYTMTFLAYDPSVGRTWLNIEPDTYNKIKVRMKLPPCTANGQLFWTTEDSPQAGDDKYMDFPVIPDGQWHEYEIPVGSHKMWQGKRICSLRLDPTVGGAEPGSQVEIDWIRGE